MRRDKWIGGLWAVVLSFFAGSAAVMCIITGFGMAVDFVDVLLWCGITAVFCGICFCLPLGPVPFCALAIVGGFSLAGGEMGMSFRAFLFRLTKAYSKTYGVAVVRPLHYTAEMLEPLLGTFLCFLGAVITLFVAWAVCRRKTILPGLFLIIFTVGTCFLVRDTVPAGPWLWTVLFCALLLLMTQAVRQEDVREGNRLILRIAPWLALFLLVIFGLTPKSIYFGDQIAGKMADGIKNSALVQILFPSLAGDPESGSSVDGETVHLANVGVREEDDSEMLRVETGYSGTLYLRGRSLDSYDGLTWTDSGVRMTRFNWPGNAALESVGEVSIWTRFAHKMLYLPYYVQSMDLSEMTLGLENETEMVQYSFSTAILANESLLQTVTGELPEDTDKYLQLSESVQDWAVPLAEEVAGDQNSVYGKAQAIGAYVRNSAAYDLNTRKMPVGKKDFARWFLQNGKTGYCVHFATASAVLLQAAGIPARYVSGYKLDVQAGCVAMVRASDAHAWVEYWLPGFGWTILESTPAAVIPQETTPEEAPTVARKPLNWTFVGIIAAAVFALAVIGAFAQRTVRLFLRRRKLHTGTLKAQILAHWQEATRFAACLQEEPDEQLRFIAEKAKYSPHEPQKEELQPFEMYLGDARNRIKSHSFFRKIYYRFILALY